MESTTIRLATKLETILYVKAQPLSINLLAEIAGCERDEVELGLIELMQDYAQRDGALELVETDAGFSLQLKASCQSLIDKLVPTDIGVGALRTLAAIALRGPIAQTDLVELRGSGAYQHVQELVERGFIQKRRQSNGRSYKVQVTEQFYQYFEVDKLPAVQGGASQQIPLPLQDLEEDQSAEMAGELSDEPLSNEIGEESLPEATTALDVKEESLPEDAAALEVRAEPIDDAAVVATEEAIEAEGTAVPETEHESVSSNVVVPSWEETMSEEATSTAETFPAVDNSIESIEREPQPV
jgi:segregation and condensation protein B